MSSSCLCFKMLTDLEDWVAVTVPITLGVSLERFSGYLNDALAGGQGQAHQAGAVNGHDLVPDIQLPRLLGRAPVHHVGNDHGW